MDGTPELQSDGRHAERVATALQFANALFEPTDNILLRPIESYIDGGKRSSTDFDGTKCVRATPPYFAHVLSQAIKRTDKTRCNLFFGVNPRFGSGNKFDLNWQIRMIRALWADVDHATHEEVLARVDAAGLPKPSILVSSGHGVHLYWKLNEPYLIDDVGNPSPVENEWPPKGERGRPKQYTLVEGQRVYVGQRHPVFELSPKAQRIQNTVTGIANLIGGDNVGDPARLLRIPGTLNRKD